MQRKTLCKVIKAVDRSKNNKNEEKYKTKLQWKQCRHKNKGVRLRKENNTVSWKRLHT